LCGFVALVGTPRRKGLSALASSGDGIVIKAAPRFSRGPEDLDRNSDRFMLGRAQQPRLSGHQQQSTCRYHLLFSLLLYLNIHYKGPILTKVTHVMTPQSFMAAGKFSFRKCLKPHEAKWLTKIFMTHKAPFAASIDAKDADLGRICKTA
jgi:hypothetical protein